MIVPLSRPDITELEIENVVAVLRTPHLSLGPRLPEFEQKFAGYLGMKHAIAVSSGTAGLHTVLISLDIGKNDAVITTPFSFIASANCILLAGATPLFIDIEPHTYNIDPEKTRDYLESHCTRNEMTGTLTDMKTGKSVKAILPVHVFGQPCDMSAIMQLADQYNLKVIEDACEAIGAELDRKKVGGFGNASVFAFYPNKQMTTGEGGMIVTNEEKIASLCRSLRNQGRDDGMGWLAHKRLGYNYRLSDINCALGIAQLERIDEMLQKREMVAARYNDLLKDIVNTPETMAGSKRSWFVYVVRLGESYSKKDRDEILKKLSEKGIGCNNYFPPIHLQPFYREMFGYKESDFVITESVSERTIALPFHNNLKEEEIRYVVDNLKTIVMLPAHSAVHPGN